MNRQSRSDWPWPRFGDSLAVLVASGVIAAMAWKRLPIPMDDPFRATLATLPLVVVALVTIYRAGVAAGGRRIPLGWWAGVGLALSVLAVAVLNRRSLFEHGGEEALAAGWFALLGAHIARQLWALRPLLGERLPVRPSLLFFALPLVAYTAIAPWASVHRQPDGDEPYYLILTHSLVHDGDTDLANNYAEDDSLAFMNRSIEPQFGDPVGDQGEIFSRHNALLPMVLAPAYAVAGKPGAVVIFLLLSAALAWMTLRLLGRYFPESPAEGLAAYGLFAFTPPMLLFSHQIWIEVPAALLTIIALDSALALKGTGSDKARAPAWTRWLVLAVAVLLLPLLKLRLLLLGLPILGLAWWRSGRRRMPLAVGLTGLVFGLAGILAFNQSRFGNPLKMYSWDQLRLIVSQPVEALAGLFGLFFDNAFGLFASAPIWCLLLPAIGLLGRKRHPLLGHLLLLAGPYLLFVAPRAEWYGGWSPPFRYGIAILPLLAISLAPLLTERGAAKPEDRLRPGASWLLGTLGVATGVLSLLWLAVPGWTYNLAHGRNHLIDLASLAMQADVGRLFPSYVRPNLAAWIWPPAVTAICVGLWWLPQRRKQSAIDEAAAPDRSSDLERGVLVGSTLVLLAAAAIPLLAGNWPSRSLEIEDPWIVRRGGHIHPETWIVQRTLHRGGWILRPNEAVEIPLVAGGEEGRLQIDLQFVRNNPDPLHLEVLQGDEILGTWQPRTSREWQQWDVGPIEPAGEADKTRLVLRAVGPPHTGLQNGILLDRGTIQWD